MHACGCRALPNGMGNPTLLPWRPVVVRRRTPFVVSDLRTKQMNKPAMRCYMPLLGHERCVQSSLPCVGMVDRGADALSPRPGMM